MSILRRTSKKGARPAAKPPRNRVTGREESATFAAAFEERGARDPAGQAPGPAAYKTDATEPSGFAKIETVVRRARVYDITMYAALRATVFAARSGSTKTVGDMVAYLHRLGFQEEPVNDAIQTWTRHIQRSA